jgi:hypothetical protein
MFLNDRKYYLSIPHRTLLENSEHIDPLKTG